MRKEITMTLVIALALVAVSVCFRQIAVRPETGILNYSFMAGLITLATALLVLFAMCVKRLFVRSL